MGTDFFHTFQVETRKVLWLIGLVLASILIIQYFELPYRDYFSSSDANREDVNGDLRHTDDLIPKSEEENISQDNLLFENTTQMNHSSDEDMIITSISPSIAASPTTVAHISPSVSVIDNSAALVSSHIAASPKSLDVVLAPYVSPSALISPRETDVDHGAPISPPIPSPENGTFSDEINGKPEKNSHPPEERPKKPVESHSPENGTSSDETNGKSERNNHPPEEKPKKPVDSVVSISEMNDLLLHSRGSSFSKSPLWPSSADQELLDVRFKIEHQSTINNRPGLYAPIYRNLSAFVRSYELMEQKLKIYVYREGKRPVFHQPRLKGIYASEGWFMKHLEASNQFLTSNPEEAHLFYLPFSSQLLVDYVYVPNSHTFEHILKYLDGYLNTIKAKHSFWNRTDGADHFVVACHDWAAFETKRLMTNCIRALCNADAKDGFQFGKDVSLPETFVHSPQNPLQETGGEPPSERKILAFFAGQMHGKVRPTLLQYWENKDPDMKIFGKLRKGYDWHMKNSKYCICAKGYEVNSPRVVEAIIYGCVPVIISDNFVPPFFDVLNWESFSVFVLEKDIPKLKEILVSISGRRYVVMQQRVKQVRKHFLWHNTAVKYDIFHMILHSVWHSRLFRFSP